MADPTIHPAFSWSPSAYGNQSTNGYPKDNQQAVVDALMQQAGDTSPAASAWQAASRGMAGLAAGLLSNPNWSFQNLSGAAPVAGGQVTPGTGNLY